MNFICKSKKFKEVETRNIAKKYSNVNIFVFFKVPEKKAKAFSIKNGKIESKMDHIRCLKFMIKS